MANSQNNHIFHYLAWSACVLALVVVVLGAYVRLSDAGLGCPDWPGCYGHLLGVPESSQEIEHANTQFPERAVEIGKAWKEVIHRYFAGLLGILILLIAISAIKNRNNAQLPFVLPLVLVGLVIFQALLGMWTVTLLLKPVIVMLHLLGGLTILALLFWLVLSSKEAYVNWFSKSNSSFRPLIVFGLLLLIIQIILGGWTSSNYAALACPDFPTCQGKWWPETDFKEGFIFWRGLGTNYEFGILENPARTAIHLSHRLAAIIVAVYWLIVLALVFVRDNTSVALRKAAIVTLIILATQILLGISNIIFHLPVSVAVMHNGGAAILLLSVVALIFYTQKRIIN